MRALDAWRIAWPDGVPVADYGKALDLARLVDAPAAPPVPRTIKDEKALALFREGATLDRVAKALGTSKQSARTRLHRLQAKGYAIEPAELESRAGAGRPGHVYRLRDPSVVVYGADGGVMR